MQLLRVVSLVILAEIKFRWILFLNRKLIRELKRLSKQDPKLLIKLKLSTKDSRKIEYDMSYMD